MAKKKSKKQSPLLVALPIFACLFAIASFVLLLTTHALTHDYTVLGAQVHEYYGPFAVMFGNIKDSVAPYAAFSSLLVESLNISWSALLAWIFVGSSMLLLLLGTIASILKLDFIKRIAPLFSFVAGGLLIAGGVLLFFTKATFYNANGYNVKDDFVLGIGWVIAAISSLVGGSLSLLPIIISAVNKK